ncbi:MAG: phosphatidate cytidylyltransferase [Desulfovibrionales bacterium]|nr:phosphatidate cytidylyltransferase [Desulfovibrionales bacterium]
MTKSHVQRVLTSILLLPILGWAIFCGDPVLSVMLTLAAAIGLFEFTSMFWPGKEKLTWKIGLIFAGMTMIWAPLTWSGTALLLLAAMGAVIFFLLIYNQNTAPNAFWDSQVLFFGLLYLPFILRLLRYLSAPEIILVLLATFATDTGAYYTGSHCGGPKIWPSISPKKTWSGSLGGLILCTLVTLALGLLLGSAHWGAWIMLGIALNLAAQLGDFFESALKRWRGIKDSGQVLPGHGGILDRIDSLLFSLPMYCGLAALVSFFPRIS